MILVHTLMTKPIPTRRRIPLLTDALEFREMTTNPLQFSINKVRKYGKVCYVPIPGVQNYFIHDPEVIKEILVTQAGKFCKSRLYKAMKRFLGEGLLSSDGAFHHQHRRLIAPAFHKQKIQEYAQTMTACSMAEITTWQAGTFADITQAMTNITMQIITNTMFGSSIEKERVRKVSTYITELLELSGKIVQNPAYVLLLEKDIRIPLIKKFYDVKSQVDAIVNSIIAESRTALESQPDAERSDLLSMLLQSRDEEGIGMSDEHIRDEMMTMFMAGHETTATALAWTWYMIGKHPKVAQKFYAEVESIIGSRTPEAEDYQRLHYTKNIFKETLRLYPPAWTFAREAVEDVDIQGYHFPKGSLLCSLMYIVQRDATYFHHPDDFLPERWDEESIKELPKYAYFPFGGGHRMCIGEGFAWMEAVMILACIASRYRLDLPQGFTTTIHPVFTLRPKDSIRMMVQKQHSYIQVPVFTP